MLNVDFKLKAADLKAPIAGMWRLSAAKLRAIRKAYDPNRGAPVFTVRGSYTSRGWTDWTLGFLFGSEILQFDATGDRGFLASGRTGTIQFMPPHLTHFGVHDHGFNIVSTYGNLLRLMDEGAIPANAWERRTYETALKVSGAVQARRWTAINNGGYIHSFNGPHSLFIDTIRSLRSLAVAHELGQMLAGENDHQFSLLERLVQHARATATSNIYYGAGRDHYDLSGRVAHEAIFNTNNGQLRCPNSQQGFSPFTTWTRGLAWAMCGFAEELEFIRTLPPSQLKDFGGKQAISAWMLQAARVTCDFYIHNTPTDGIPYWDTGAPRLVGLGDYLDRAAEPFNDCEPVDSSAAAIAAQGLIRLGNYLGDKAGRRYFQAGLTVLRTLLDEPYISTAHSHQGLLLHSVYHRPNGWDYIPNGRTIPCGESSMWGDYHLREAALCVQRLADGSPYLTFWRKQA